MIQRTEDLLREVLALPAQDRADFAAEVVASLDDPTIEDPAEVEAAWAKEIEGRARRVLNGETEGEPWEGVRERILKRLGER